jgi:methylamine dehydrogenase heavy chain
MAKLPETPDPHWVWVNDFNLEAGKAYLIDGDSGRVLGMLSTGRDNIVLAMPTDNAAIYSPETYLDRGTRGRRTDLITIYDPVNLAAIDEIEIPPKRAQSSPTFGHVALTDDDRFLTVYNFTPAQSVSIVDVKRRKFLGEIETPGCALAYPFDERRFFSICGDGSLLIITLGEDGKETGRLRSRPFFDWSRDFVSERPVRRGAIWYFLSVEGNVYPVDLSGAEPSFLDEWSLLDAGDRAQSWTISGMQPAAVHQATGRLFTLMHQGDRDSRKDPGKEVWVHDFASHRRLQRITLKDQATAIQVSQDDAPLLYAISVETAILDIYDALTGEHRLRTESIGQIPTMLQTPPTGSRRGLGHAK